MGSINEELLALLDLTTIQDEVINKLTDTISASIDIDLRNKLFVEAETRVYAVVAAIVEEATTQTFQPTTSWGEPNGKPTTVKNMIEASIKDWWDVKVDSQGRPSSYNCKPRAQHYAEKVVGEYVNQSLQREMRLIIEDGKVKIRAAMGESIAKQIKQIW